MTMQNPFAHKLPKTSFTVNSIPQSLFLHSPSDECLYWGAKGCGKSHVLLWCFLQHVGKPNYGHAWKGVIFRRAIAQLQELIDILRNELREHFHPLSYKWNIQARSVTFVTGEFLTLTYMDGKEGDHLVQGRNFCFIGWDEIPLFPDYELFARTNLSLRSGKAGGPKQIIRCTANPSNTGGGRWVRKYFLGHCNDWKVTNVSKSITRQAIRGLTTENLDLMEATKGESGGNKYMERMKMTLSEDEYKRLALAEWPETCDGFFDGHFDHATHKINPFQIPTHWKIDRTFDWGTARPFSALWFAEARKGINDPPGHCRYYDVYGGERTVPIGTIFCIKEFYGGNGNVGFNWTCDRVAREVNATDEQLGDQYKIKVLPGAADRMIFEEKSYDSIAKMMSRFGVTWKMADQTKHSRIAGATKFKQMLRNSILGEQPGFYVFSICENWLEHVPNLPPDENNPEDVAPNTTNHDWDATRYRIHNTYEQAKPIRFKL